MKAAWALALMLAVGTCAGQSLEWQGGFAAIYEHDAAPFDSTVFRWSHLIVQDNVSGTETSENVTLYAKMHKLGPGRSWSLVAETQCVFQRGGCHVAEFDLVVAGAVKDGDWRLGGSTVMWTPQTLEQTAALGGAPMYHHLWLYAIQWDQRNALRGEHGVTVDAYCTMSCLTIRAGQRFGLEMSGQIAIRYDQTAHEIQFLNGSHVLAVIPTGAIANPNAPRAND